MLLALAAAMSVVAATALVVEVLVARGPPTREPKLAPPKKRNVFANARHDHRLEVVTDALADTGVEMPRALVDLACSYLDVDVRRMALVRASPSPTQAQQIARHQRTHGQRRCCCVRVCGYLRDHLCDGYRTEVGLTLCVPGEPVDCVYCCNLDRPGDCVLGHDGAAAYRRDALRCGLNRLQFDWRYPHTRVDDLPGLPGATFLFHTPNLSLKEMAPGVPADRDVFVRTGDVRLWMLRVLPRSAPLSTLVAPTRHKRVAPHQARDGGDGDVGDRADEKRGGGGGGGGGDNGRDDVDWDSARDIGDIGDSRIQLLSVGAASPTGCRIGLVWSDGRHLLRRCHYDGAPLTRWEPATRRWSRVVSITAAHRAASLAVASALPASAASEAALREATTVAALAPRDDEKESNGHESKRAYDGEYKRRGPVRGDGARRTRPTDPGQGTRVDFKDEDCNGGGDGRKEEEEEDGHNMVVCGDPIENPWSAGAIVNIAQISYARATYRNFVVAASVDGFRWHNPRTGVRGHEPYFYALGGFGKVLFVDGDTGELYLALTNGDGRPPLAICSTRLVLYSSTAGTGRATAATKSATVTAALIRTTTNDADAHDRVRKLAPRQLSVGVQRIAMSDVRATDRNVVAFGFVTVAVKTRDDTVVFSDGENALVGVRRTGGDSVGGANGERDWICVTARNLTPELRRLLADFSVNVAVSRGICVA